jgi:SagB-type dehydrogenase family enzyme
VKSGVHAEVAPPPPVLSLDPRTTLERGPEGELVVRHALGLLRFGEEASWLAALLEELGAPGATQEALEDRVLAAHGPHHLAELYYVLLQLQRLGILRHSLVVSQVTWLEILASPPRELFRATAVAANEDLRLSRFATIRASGDALVAESLHAQSRVLVSQPEVGDLLMRLASPQSTTELMEPGSGIGLDAEVLVGSVSYLCAAGILSAREQGGTAGEATDPALQVWEPHDLAFHRRSRRGHHADPIGGTYRLRGLQEPEPALAPPKPGRRLALPVPDVRALETDDPPLFRVMESRRSIRQYGAPPISIDQLGELLYRVARVRGHLAADHEAERLYELTDRPYPSGGGAYELELYLTVAACDRLERGSYYYDAADHSLVRLETTEEQVQALLADASLATGGEANPQVLVTVTSRFKRLAWKYSGMAYATTLKNLGVLYQSLYLAATAMGLAPCALGSGDSSSAVAAFGLDELRECPIGEFILGSAPAAASSDD